MKTIIAFGVADTGLTWGALTVQWCKDLDGANLSTTGATLTEIGLGRYALNLPAVSVGGSIYLYKTADATVYAEKEWGVSYDPTTGSDTGSNLCTLADVKTALNVTSSDKDTLISALIVAASRWIEGHCQRTFASTSYTEVFSPGRDGRILRSGTVVRPRQYPIISVTSLHESSVRTFDATSLLPATDYAIGQGSLTVELLDDGTTIALQGGQRTVQLIYVAGYATIPGDLQRAAVMLAVHLYHKADRQKQNVASESLGGVTVSYLNETMPKEAQAIVDRYRRPFGL